ncbi:MAG: MGMT family protein [Myxococcota bacterium]
MTHQAILRVVRRIPKGRVSTYGEVARLAGLPGHARQVGYALAGLGDPSVPWQRVINAKGQISLRGEAMEVQRALLLAEGVEVDEEGRIDLSKFGPKSPRSKRRKV